MRRVVIIGAGVGGLTAAIRLAREGSQVTVLEARDRPGGLAASFELDGFRFDAGPYILLDRPGLEWALSQVGMDVAEHLQLQRIGRRVVARALPRGARAGDAHSHGMGQHVSSIS